MHTTSTLKNHRHRIDVRRRALVITALSTIALGAIFAGDIQPPTKHRQPVLRFADVLQLKPKAPLQDKARAAQVRTRFEQGVTMLRMKQYEYALAAFHQVLALEPRLPEAHVNMGFALLGLGQWKGARDFFESAIDLRRDQMNAYYGLASALEGLGDMPGAMGAMQAYLHRAHADDPFRSRAESALWEWRNGKDNAAPGAAPKPAVIDLPPATEQATGRR